MLAYDEHGYSQGKQAVVLLHGFCGSTNYWDKLVPLLSDKFRWILPDLRGHGKSAGLTSHAESFTMEQLANDVAELLQHIGIEQAVLLGHSLGGYITLAFAEKFQERIKGIGLIHSTALPDDEKGKEGRTKSIKSIKENGFEAFINGLVPKLFAPDNVEHNAADVNRAKQIGYGTDVNGAMYTLEGMKNRIDRRTVLENVSVPVLLLAGEKDNLISPDKTFSVKGAHITQEQISNAGHMSMLETPEQLAKVMHDFLDLCC